MSFSTVIPAQERRMLAIARVPGQICAVFGMTLGELGLAAFMVIAIVSARAWPKMGEWLVRRWAGKDG